MNPLNRTFAEAIRRMPLVAILRGIRPDEVEAIALTLYEYGFRLIEIPMNSPDALDSVSRLARCLPDDALYGAGTVTDTRSVQDLHAAGARLIVMPHSDIAVIHAAKKLNLICIPGAITPTEVFAALHAGADAIKLFPVDLLQPSGLRALRSVLPSEVILLPVGGVTPQNLARYQQAGANGAGLGSSLYRPGMNATDIATRAQEFITAWQHSEDQPGSHQP